MTFKQLLLSVAAVMMAGSMSAQTDVTSTYLTNADFSQGTLASPAIPTYAKDMASNGTTFCNLVALDGWTAVDNGDGKAGGPVAIGSGVWIGGSGYSAPPTNSDGEATGNVLGIVGCWGASAQYTQTIKQAFPAGKYTIVLAVYNSKGGTNAIAKNLIGFVSEGGTEYLATTKQYPVNTWKYEFITVDVAEATSGYITIGYNSTGTGSGNMPHLFVSGLEIYEGEVDADAYEAAKALKRSKGVFEQTLISAKAVDQTQIMNATVLSDFKEAIANYEGATYDNAADYETATNALETAMKSVETSVAVYKEIAIWNAKAEKLNDDGKAEYAAILDAYNNRTATDAASAKEKYEEQVLLGNYVEGADITAFATNPSFEENSLNGWTATTGFQKQTNNTFSAKVGNVYAERWQASGGLSDGSITQTISGLPQGRYTVSAAMQNLNGDAQGAGFYLIANTDKTECTVNGEVVSVTTIVTDGTLTLGAKLEGCTGNYISVDNFIITFVESVDFMAIAKAELATAIKAANDFVAANPAGDAPLFRQESAHAALNAVIINVQAVYDDAESTLEQINTAKTEIEEALATYQAAAVNPLDASKKYTFINVSEGYGKKGQALTFKSASNADLAANTTAMGYTELPGSVYPQAVTLTAVEGVENGFTFSYTRADGNVVYASTGLTSGLGNNTNQIRPTTDAAKALTIQLQPTATVGVYKLYNTEANNTLGGNGKNDTGFFTTAQYNDFQMVEAVENEYELTITAENKYATVIVPFDAALPTGVKAYTADDVNDNEVVLNEAATLKANTPYVVYAEEGATATLSGLGSAYTDATYTAGLLTGAYAAFNAPVGSYVLQNQGGDVKFYVVEGEAKAVAAGHAYLTAPTAGEAKALGFSAITTAIQNLEVAKAAQNGAIFNLNGQRVNTLQKGINIVGGKKVLVK